jgi:hypothetical protein
MKNLLIALAVIGISTLVYRGYKEAQNQKVKLNK